MSGRGMSSPAIQRPWSSRVRMAQRSMLISSRSGAVQIGQASKSQVQADTVERGMAGGPFSDGWLEVRGERSVGVACAGGRLVLGLDRVDDALGKVGADLVAVGTDGCLEGVTREAT